MSWIPLVLGVGCGLYVAKQVEKVAHDRWLTAQSRRKERRKSKSVIAEAERILKEEGP